ncbi:MAG: hypothetical protein OHK0045_08690 [Raineya sp.]
MKKALLAWFFLPCILLAQKIDKASIDIDLSATPHFWQMGNLNQFLQENAYNGLNAFYAPISLGFAIDNPQKRFSFGADVGSMKYRNNSNDNSTASLHISSNVRFAYHLVNANHFRLQPSLGIGHRLTQIDARRGNISNNFSNIPNTNNDGLSLRHESYGLEMAINGLCWISDSQEDKKTLSYLGLGIGFFQPLSNSWRAYDVPLENAPKVNSGGVFVKFTLGTFIFKN